MCPIPIAFWKVANLPPVASSVSKSGNLFVAETLTGSYTYTDPETNPEGTSTYKWYRSDDSGGTNKAAISAATSITYKLVVADALKYISFEVTPVDSYGRIGIPVESTRTIADYPASGGTITISGNNRIHTFTSPASYTFHLLITKTVDYLIVAGGGGGGNGYYSGGGGAGGVRSGSASVTANYWTVTVGAGGVNSTQPQWGTNGTNSYFQGVALTATGGGGGGTAGLAARPGRAGGSGGGGASAASTDCRPAGAGNAGGYSPVEGYTGGVGAGNSGIGAGGGGSGGAGQNGTTGAPGSTVGHGGIGVSSSITGSSLKYAAGGNGGYMNYESPDSIGGLGGAGTAGVPILATAGVAGTGSGGGGSRWNNIGGNGADGIVIISYSLV